MTNEEAIQKFELAILNECMQTKSPADRHCIELFDTAIKSLKQTIWIPVSKQLPKADGMYLVTTTGTYNDVVDIAYYYKDIGFHKASKVLAWMQLPEAYKEGDTE